MKLKCITGIALAAVFLLVANFTARAEPAEKSYSLDEIVKSGQNFFGETSGGLAEVIENAFKRFGLPNGYILGQEGSGAFIGGLTYGEGTLNTKAGGSEKIYWQGPSLGWDVGGQGSQVMMLAYNIGNSGKIHGRFGGVSGSAYVVAGAGFNVLKRGDVVLVPIHTGVGARLGVNIGYLKLTNKPTWNPF